MEQPLVSVVTPAYNHGRYIGRCIESLLAQTYANWELMVVDDGSTDNTAEVVLSYKDPRISYMHQDNKGVGALAETINSGVRRSKGKLVTMLGSDDMWPPYRLEKQVPVFRDAGVVLCFGRGVIIDEEDRVIGQIRPPRKLTACQNRPVGAVLRWLVVQNQIPQYTVLISRAALDRIGGYLQPPGLLAEDYPTHMALAMVGEFRYLDLALGYYRMHPSQMTRTHHLEMVKTDLAYALEFFRSLDTQTQKLTGWTEARLAKRLSNELNDAYFYVGRRDLAAGNRSGARSHLATALFRGTPKTKAKAVVGLLCAVTGLDMERVARWVRRPALH